MDNSSRRDFLKSSSVATGSALFGALGTNYAFAEGSDKIKVGVIGCGGRGTGAIRNVLDSAPNVQIVAMGDMFQQRLDNANGTLAAKNPGGVVPADRCFIGFDAYKKVLASDVNYVILATPPGFRPMQFKAAIEAGKNVFTEKPIAVDAPGVRLFLEANEMAIKRGLAVTCGLQRHHQQEYVDTIKRIHDGAIGQVTSMSVYWNQGHLWVNEREPGWSDMEYQLRNWYYFVWLCGDHIVEQHVHNVDVANWVLGAHPIRAYGMGGRQVRTAPKFGHIYDHFTVEYEYANGARVLSMCRQIDGTASRVAEFAIGTKGTAIPSGTIKVGEQTTFRAIKGNDPYVQEHSDNILGIRAGKPLNEGKFVAESTLSVIMGRESAYTGQIIEWEDMLNSKKDYAPAKLSMDAVLPVPEVAMPGTTKFF